MIASREVEAVAGNFHVPIDDLLGDSRNRTVSKARQVLWWLMRDRGLDNGSIGAEWGKHRCTVVFGLQQVAKRCRLDPEFDALVQRTLRRSRA